MRVVKARDDFYPIVGEKQYQPGDEFEVSEQEYFAILHQVETVEHEEPQQPEKPAPDPPGFKTAESGRHAVSRDLKSRERAIREESGGAFRTRKEKKADG
jgi:hypothetical protein